MKVAPGESRLRKTIAMRGKREEYKSSFGSESLRENVYRYLYTRLILISLWLSGSVILKVTFQEYLHVI
jgi:hypothetical protein